MPLFDYKALNSAGKVTKGIIESDSLKNARGKLKKSGLMVTEIQEKTAAKAAASSGIPFFGGGVKLPEVSQFVRQLASLVKANVPLVEAMGALVEQTENQTLKVTLAKIRDDVNEGSSLSKAMAQHPKIFDNIFINMVEAGESSGTLGLVLLRLADLKEAQLRLRNKVVSAMTYPVLMLGVAGIMMIAIFAFVIPKLAKIFESMNKPLPASTKVLMQISDVFLDFWYLFIGGGIAAVVMFTNWINSKDGRPKWDAMKLKFPVVGPLLRLIGITRFATTMGTLLGSGVQILTAMNIAKNLVGNTVIANAISAARDNISEGQSIAEPLRRSGEFPPLVIHMIAIGEKTGELSEMLKNVSESYEEQIDTKIQGMTALLEPAMMILMGGVVGFIVLSIFVPLLDMGNLK